MQLGSLNRSSRFRFGPFELADEIPAVHNQRFSDHMPTRVGGEKNSPSPCSLPDHSRRGQAAPLSQSPNAFPKSSLSRGEKPAINPHVPSLAETKGPLLMNRTG